VAEQVTLIDLCNQYASGQLDNSEAIPAELAIIMVACSLRRNKREIVMVSPDYYYYYYLNFTAKS